MRRAAGCLALAAVLAACGGDGGGGDDRTSLLAAGDIAACWWRGDEATARLLDRYPDAVIATVGDNVYPSGSRQQFRDCYHPTWGRHLERTRPAVGNHEYKTRDAAGYFEYFGARAGPRGKGWYSYDHDGWHLVVLNSELDLDEGSEQLRWLQGDLRRHRARCTLAYFHHPGFSSGRYRDRERDEALWRVLYEHGVDVVLAGHDHHYERFARLTPDGRPDPRRGIRQFIVGTGGAPSYTMGKPVQHSEAIAVDTRGVLRLVFHPDAYEWEFIPIPGRRFADKGRDRCS
ncbi:MAG TPA: metallophosphoesterase [Longimicrobium sp.]|nr:metallophosphoesterase [Longimicrobium sp.]